MANDFDLKLKKLPAYCWGGSRFRQLLEQAEPVLKRRNSNMFGIEIHRREGETLPRIYSNCSSVLRFHQRNGKFKGIDILQREKRIFLVYRKKETI